MAELSVKQNTILRYFQDNQKGFLIPDYQRPYSWEEDQCEKLWNDLATFTLPELQEGRFDPERNYYLGSIVTFVNQEGKTEIIDGQQRIITLMLLLRAFLKSAATMPDPETKALSLGIQKCLWHMDEFDIKCIATKLETEVASDDAKKDFLAILDTGNAPAGAKNRYAKNYRFFEKKIAAFKNDCPSYFAYFPQRAMRNCVLFPIETSDQDAALLIFSTLNDRGLPLSDADIFYSKLYKFYKEKGEEERSNFVEQWRDLSERCEQLFHPYNATPMDELFIKYMFYRRALENETGLMTQGTRSFFEKNDYSILRKDEVFPTLQKIARFWSDIFEQDTSLYSLEVLKRFSILAQASNILPSHFITVYYLLEPPTTNEAWLDLLERLIACVLLYAVCKPGLDYLRTPLYNEMAHYAKDRTIDFTKHALGNQDYIREAFETFSSSRNQSVKFLLYWYAYQNPQQELIPTGKKISVEHIFSKNRATVRGALDDPSCVELIGNKSIMESNLNIRASDFRFEDKRAYYLGTRDDKRKPTMIRDLRELASNKADFTEEDIKERTECIFQTLLSFLRRYDLVK